MIPGLSDVAARALAACDRLIAYGLDPIADVRARHVRDLIEAMRDACTEAEDQHIGIARARPNPPPSKPPVTQ